MNIADKFAELSIASSKLTKKKQQTKKKIEYVSEYVRLWALVMLERTNIDTLNFIDCMCNAGVYQDGDCCTSIEVLQALSHSLHQDYGLGYLKNIPIKNSVFGSTIMTLKKLKP